MSTSPRRLPSTSAWTSCPSSTRPPRIATHLPFPYGGHRFEFRAVGSSQNVSLVNTVLNALTRQEVC